MAGRLQERTLPTSLGPIAGGPKQCPWEAVNEGGAALATAVVMTADALGTCPPSPTTSNLALQLLVLTHPWLGQQFAKEGGEEKDAALCWTPG